MDRPRLIDTQTNEYLHGLLQQCHNNRVETYSYFFNIVVVVVFLSFVSIILYYSFTTKKTPEEKEIDKIKDQKYVLDKIKELQVQRKAHQELITNLPH